MKIPVLCCLLLVSLAPLFSQTSLHIAHGCAYKNAAEDVTLYTFDPSEEARRIVSEICNAMGVSQNFDLRAASVENALATTEGKRRIILYSTVFLKKFNDDARTRWAAYSVLAHEIGHHFNGHDFAEERPAERKRMELEADRFSGAALRLLDASLDEAKAGLETFALDLEQQYHPAARGRVEAVATGWNQMQERLETISGGTLKPGTSVPRERDTDGDGISDRNDACPEEYGRSLTAGCPDGDEDGIPDRDDQCPFLKGPAEWKGCPDSDGDGIPNHEDRCPKDPGELADMGCPPPDRDGDSVNDRADKCPDAPGLPRYQGCPDTDGDGVPDHKDKCPKEKGDPVYEGCEAGRQTLSWDAENMVYLLGGKFKMGANAGMPKELESLALPVHQVAVSDFYLSKYEVTQSEWKRIMGNNPSKNPACDNCPVDNVTWEDVQTFLSKLNALYSSPVQSRYRLPTEAEWEYAARGGGKSKKYVYAGSNDLDKVGWWDEFCAFDPECIPKIHELQPVGKLKPNELGLYDMSGNASEWCADYFHPNYQGAPTDGSARKLKSEKDLRVIRGGTIGVGTNLCRVDCRIGLEGKVSAFNSGFRIARSWP